MAKKDNSIQSNVRPIGVSILAILGYIGAVITLLAGVAMIFGSTAIVSILSAYTSQLSILSTLGTILFIVLGIVFIALAVLDYFIARGLWNGRNWARILTLIFAAIGVINAVLNLSIVTIVIDGVIIWYLGFYKPAIKYFK